MWTPGDLTVLVPMLGRPETVAPLLASLDATTAGAEILFLVTPDDEPVKATLDAHGAYWMPVEWQPHGDYARKINTGYRNTTRPLLFMGACDLRFHEGWFHAAAGLLDDTIQVVGTNDLGNPRTVQGNHSTHSLLTRTYADRGTIDQPRTILHEGYIHEYVDDEFVQTARARGVYRQAKHSRVEHLHPMWGKADWDDSYRGQKRRMRASRPLYTTRRALWT